MRIGCFWLSTLGVFFWGASVTPIFACSPPFGGFPPYTVVDRTRAADVVLEGVVVSVMEDVPEFGLQTATVQVNQYLKGDGPQTISVTNFGQTSLCLTTVFIDDHRVFYLKGDAETGFKANYLTAHDAVDAVNDAVLGWIAVGIEPPVYLPALMVGGV